MNRGRTSTCSRSYVSKFFAASGLAKLNEHYDGRTWEDVVFKDRIFVDPYWSEVLQLHGGKLPRLDADRYVKGLWQENGLGSEEDIFFRPFKLGVMAGIEAGQVLSPELRTELMSKTVHYLYEPPKYLYSEDFLPLTKLWGKDLLKFLWPRLDGDYQQKELTMTAIRAIGSQRHNPAAA